MSMEGEGTVYNTQNEVLASMCEKNERPLDRVQYIIFKSSITDWLTATMVGDKSVQQAAQAIT